MLFNVYNIYKLNIYKNNDEMSGFSQNNFCGSILSVICSDKVDLRVFFYIDSKAKTKIVTKTSAIQL